jgi:hypothetical protein
MHGPLDVFRRVATLRPDIVVVTRDFVSHHDGMFSSSASWSSR